VAAVAALVLYQRDQQARGLQIRLACGLLILFLVFGLPAEHYGWTGLKGLDGRSQRHRPGSCGVPPEARYYGTRPASRMTLARLAVL
jgi:hypothetical protein